MELESEPEQDLKPLPDIIPQPKLPNRSDSESPMMRRDSPMPKGRVRISFFFYLKNFDFCRKILDQNYDFYENLPKLR